MTNHHPNQPAEEVNIQINEPGVKPSGSQILVITSILFGALLISASVFYNAKLILKKLDAGTGNSLAAFQAQNQNPSQVQGPGNAVAPPPNDTAPVKVNDRQDQPALGSKNAKITVYEFSDFQCPYCKKFYDDAFKSLKSKYIDTGKIKFVYRHYPLPFHANAQKAAEAAECANRQGRFEQYHDVLFKNAQSDGAGLAVADLKKYADELGLNKGTLGFQKNRFNQCLDSGEAAAAVKQDVSDGSAVGVNGTPTLFIAGKKIVGAQPLAVFEQAIEAALK